LSTLETPREASAPYMSVSWHDTDTGARGYLVIDTLIRGVAGGGLRMRAGCTLGEVADLARAMTSKEAIAYRPGARYTPLGGGKGGIDFDPADPRAGGVLRGYLEAMLPFLRHRWATGEDLGVRQDELDLIAPELGLRSTVDAVLPLIPDGADAGLGRLAAAFAVRERGIGLGELVGGYGVARAGLRALAELGREPAGAAAVVQGFGSMGGASARYLVDAGVRVVAIADADGLVVNEAGLDVEAMLSARDRFGRIDRSALRGADATAPREEWVTVPCDVLVPAATSYALDERAASAVRAAVVVEAANVATLPAAEVALAARGIPVVPDFIANLATNAWWWWTLFGDIEPTTAAAFAQIEQTLDALVAEAFARARPGEPLRAVALAMARERGRAAAAEAARRGEPGP
jgi:glutamate dehydrogenase (NAD(P)+)